MLFNSKHKHYWILAFSLTSLVSFLQLYLPLKRGGDAPFFWSGHAEGVSLTTIGRWSRDLVARDGMSGEFHVLYQYLSDWLINRAAEISGSPPFEIQVYYGAFLAGALVLVTFALVLKFLESPSMALLAACLVAVSSDPILVDPLYLLAGEQSTQVPDIIFHVPSSAIVLGTAQGLAYLLFIPAFLSVFLALWRGSYVYAVAAGLLFGAMIQTSFLTFIGLVSAVGVGLSSVALLHHATRNERRIVTLKFAVLLVGISAVVFLGKDNFTPMHFVLMWSILFTVGLTSFRSIALLATMGLASLIVASPFLLHLLEVRSALTQLEGPVDSPVRLLTVLIFFLPAWVALVLLGFRHNALKGKSYEFAYLVGAVIALLLISKGDLWGFRNHQYRFVILLLFPLSIVFALAVLTRWSGKLRYVAAILLVWMSASMLRNLIGIAGVDRAIYNALGVFYNYADYNYAGKDWGTYLLTIERATAEAAEAGSRRILLAPEYNYPAMLRDSALALGVSSIPAFIPDYRYLVDRASYDDRLRVFCFLFPDYPHHDQHTGRRACQGVNGSIILDEGRPILAIRDLSLKAGLFDLLDIGLAADLGSPFRDELLKYARPYSLEPIMSEGPAVVMKYAPVPGKTTIKSKGWDDEGWALTVTAPTAGRHTVILSGKGIGAHFASARFEVGADQQWTLRRDVFVGTANLAAGANELRLRTCTPSGGPRGPALSPFHFVAAIPENEVDLAIEPVGEELARRASGVTPASQACT